MLTGWSCSRLWTRGLWVGGRRMAHSEGCASRPCPRPPVRFVYLSCSINSKFEDHARNQLRWAGTWAGAAAYKYKRKRKEICI